MTLKSKLKNATRIAPIVLGTTIAALDIGLAGAMTVLNEPGDGYLASPSLTSITLNVDRYRGCGMDSPYDVYDCPGIFPGIFPHVDAYSGSVISSDSRGIREEDKNFGDKTREAISFVMGPLTELVLAAGLIFGPAYLAKRKEDEE